MKRFIFSAVFVVAVVEVAIGLVVYYSFENWGDRGTFGDMFGAANALFSGLAFMGVVYAIYLQQQELGLQRTELLLTRQELTRSADAANIQADHMRNSSLRSEIKDVIDRIENDLVSAMNVEVINKNENDSKIFLKKVLFDLLIMEYGKILPMYDQFKDMREDDTVSYSNVRLYESVSMVVKHMNLLGEYLNEYKKASKNNVFSEYYITKYRVPAKRLISSGFPLVAIWADA